MGPLRGAHFRFARLRGWYPVVVDRDTKEMQRIRDVMRYALLVLTLFLAAPGADAAEVRLKDGTVVIGTIIRLIDGEDLVVDTEYMDEVTIEWDAIVAVRGTQVVEVELFDGSRQLGTVTFDESGFSVVGDDTLMVNPKDVFAMSEVNETFWEALNAYTDLGMNVVRGNNQVTQVSFGGAIACGGPLMPISGSRCFRTSRRVVAYVRSSTAALASTCFLTSISSLRSTIATTASHLPETKNTIRV